MIERETDMKTVLNLLNNNVMKNAIKYICALLLLMGVNVSAWGTESSFDVSSITINNVNWGTETTYLEKYVGYDNGSIVTANNSSSVSFQFSIGDEFNNDHLYAFVEDHTDGFGLTIDGVNPNSGYVGYISPSSSDYAVGDNVAITLHYVISSPRTSHSARLKFCRYDYDDPSADDNGWVTVLSIPITINMTGGYAITTAVTPAATGTVVATVGGEVREQVMADEQLDLVATPADGYQFFGWETSGNSTTDWLIDNDENASTYAYIYANQTITANFELACTSHTITLSGSPAGTVTNGTFSADRSSACEDAIITLSASPASGYELDTWTVNKSGGGTCTVNGSNQFTMPDVDVTVNATFQAATYTLSFDANGGTGSMDPEDRVYNTTAAIPANAFTAPSGKVFDGWTTSLGGEKVYEPGANYTMGAGDATLYAHWRDGILSDYVFSCAELTLTGPTGDLVFITSTASKTVRSQEAFHVTGNGLTPSTTLTFTMSNPTVAGKFAFKEADGSAVATDASGEIDVDFYVYYTPASGDTEDGLDQFTNLKASVTGAKPKSSNILDDKTVIGRHLPADFVIAAKRKGKWYALPADMTTGTPSPVEIAVNDADNPSMAYTATTNMYSLYDQNDGASVKLAMQGQSNAPLYAANSTSGIGKSSATVVTNEQSNDYLWIFAQTNTSITNAQDAKYTMKCVAPYNNYFVRLMENAGNPQWGQYSSGINEIRLIPARTATVAEAYFIEYGTAGGVIEVDANGMSATKVQATFDGHTSSMMTLNQTQTSGGSASKYNYTVSFDNDINFAADNAVGKILLLEWYNSSYVLVGITSIELPKIIASDKTMMSVHTKTIWQSFEEVHVLPEATLTANTAGMSDYGLTLKHLEIYPGATVNITSASNAGTLTVTELVMRNGWSRAGTKRYDVARLYIQPYESDSKKASTLVATNAYADWYIDFDQYYPVAVPWRVTTSGMSYKNSRSAASAGVKMRYYDGAGRANGTNGSAAEGTNWIEYNEGGTRYPATLEPGKGYAMTARRPTGKAFSIVRMPLTIPDGWTTEGEKGAIGETHKDQVSVTAHGADNPSKPEYVKGWNFIANPYMSLHQGALSYTDAGTIEYANIPDINFKEYDQQPITTTKLKPSSGFLIQAPKTGTATFGEANRKAAAPSYRREVIEEKPVQRAYITLANDEAEDMMGILVADQYTETYETNADLQKLLGDGTSLKTYMYYGEMNMAYLALNKTLAEEWIPVTVRIPANDEFTFSLHEASVADELEGVYLIDYQEGTMTNLLDENYTFYSVNGTITGRFAINAKAGERQTPTGIDVVQGEDGEPVKFIYHDNVYILHNNVIYDATGKKVK